MAVDLTDAARTQARKLIQQRNGIDPVLKLSVSSGGCSGLMYDLEWVAAAGDKDKVFTFGDVDVAVDRKSYLFLNGIVLDFEDTLVRSGFVFHNPAAKRSCSCGESFTV